MDQNKLIETFVTEASELVQDLEIDLVALEDNGDDDELINRIFRAAHTIKGSAGVVGLTALSNFTHSMEGVLDLVRDHKLAVSSELVSVLLKAVDLLKDMIGMVTDSSIDIDDQELQSVLNLLGQHLAGEVDAPVKSMPLPGNSKQSEVSYFEIEMRLPENLFETGTDPLMLLRELNDLGEIVELRVNTEKVPNFHALDPYKLYLGWHLVIKTSEPYSRIENTFVFVQDDGDILIEDVSRFFKNGVDARVADMKLGEILADEGIVTRDDIDEVLSKQQKVGELLVSSGKALTADVQNALDKQLKSREVQKASTIRVSTDRLDRLVNTVGELVIAVARVTQQVISQSNSSNRVAQGSVEALDRICRELQEQVMRVRMVSVEGLFSRFHRIVRDLANDEGKSVYLELTGTETELDKNVIEQISDPLKHLIRNAIDHGIEMPQERLDAGKDEEATVTLSAYQQEGNIIIEVSDDGRGIDCGAVLNKAVEKGFVKPGDEPGEQELYQYMFMPGFSTAKEVTEVSGRGVGLDVVKQNISELNGSIEVVSTLGKGTTFRVKLPLTLAIIDGMSVLVGSEVLTIPILSIVGSVQPKKEGIKTVVGKGEVIDVRGEYLPLVRLYDLFGLEADKKDPTQALVVIVEGSQRRFGMLVDDVLGQQQAVIKSLDKNFRQVDGTAGATILGDGTVSLILDIHSIEKMAFDDGEKYSLAS